MAARAIVGDIGVVEIRWQPAGGRVAIVAIIAAGNMRWMSSGRLHPVVTTAARAKNLGVINGKDRREDVSGMAVLAYVGRLHMRGSLTGGIGAVVAVNAVAGDVDVVEISR